MTTELPELPAGWEWCELQDVAEVRLGRQRSPKNHAGENMVPYLRAANVTWDGLSLDDVKEMNFTPDEVETYALCDGDIVMSEASGSASEVGKPAIWRGELKTCCFQNTLIRVRSEGPLPEYLLLVLREDALAGRFGQAALGVGIHHLGAARLSRWPVPVPPIAEQTRIVQRVRALRDEVAAGQLELASAQAQLDRLEGAIVDEAVSRTAGHADRVPLGDVLDRMTSGSRDWKQYYHRGSGVFVLAQNVRPRRLDFSTVLHVDPPSNDASRTRSAVARDDVLITIVGAGTGTVARVPDDLPEHWVCQSVALLRPRGDLLDGRYLELFLSAPGWGQRAFGQLMYGQGRPHLGFAEMKRIQVPIPSLKEQREIADRAHQRLSELPNLLAPLTELKAEAMALDRAIIRAGVRGELNTASSSDEPAATLLGRIRESRKPSTAKTISRSEVRAGAYS